MSEHPVQRQVRISTSPDPVEQRREYESLRDNGHMKYAVIICHLVDDNYLVLGQDANIVEIGNLIATVEQCTTNLAERVADENGKDDGTGLPGEAQQPQGSIDLDINTLAAGWAQVASSLPSDLSKSDRKMARACFYTGASRALFHMRRAVVADDEATTEPVVILNREAIVAVTDETRRYFDLMDKQGEADPS